MARRFRVHPGAAGRADGRRPPRFAVFASAEGDRHATRPELFFDVVFVLAIAELAGYLHDHLTAAGLLGFVLLLLPARRRADHHRDHQHLRCTYHNDMGGTIQPVGQAG